MTNLLERFAEEVATETTIEGLDRALEKALRELGFPFWTYGNVLMGGEILRYCLKTTVDPMWWKHYLAEDYAGHDPVMQQLPYRSGVYAWEETKARASTRGFQCLEEGREAGLTNGYAMSLRQPGAFHAFSAAGREEPLDLLERIVLQGIVELYHHCRRALGDRQSNPFTPRQIEYLHWGAEGKTNSETGIICGVTAQTVKKRVNEATQRLGTTGRMPTTLIAVGTGNIMPNWLRPQRPPRPWDHYANLKKGDIS